VEKIWLKSYQKNVPEEINPDRYNSLVDLLMASFEKYQSKPAYQHLGHKLSYAKLDHLSRKVSAYLRQELGLQKGQRVALMMPNVLQYPVALFGVLRAGLVVVNVNPLYTPDELAFQLNDAQCDTIIVLSNFANTVEKVIDKTPLKNIIISNFADLFPAPKSWIINFVVKYIKKIVPDYNIKKSIAFKEMLRKGSRLKLSEVDINSEDLAFLQYTGGTTGIAKGAMLTHRNMVANVLQCDAFLRHGLAGNDHIVITALPMYHIFSLTVNCLWFFEMGAMNVLITNPRDIPDFVKQIKSIPFTAITGVNTLYNGLLNSRDFRNIDFRNLRLAIAGGMALQEKVARSWQKVTNTVLLQGYGLTETSPVATCNPIDIEGFTGSIGLPLSSTEVSIRDESGNELACNEEGELCIRGLQVMQGYWNSPKETAEVLSDDGWLRTGDIANIDELGFVRIVDRKKDMIIVSGFNVYPNEIEEVISNHPAVIEVGVVGVPSEDTGEKVKAFVVSKDSAVEAAEIIRYCKDHLTAYKIPKEVIFCGELPKTNVGKILRRALRD